MAAQQSQLIEARYQIQGAGEERASRQSRAHTRGHIDQTQEHPPSMATVMSATISLRPLLTAPRAFRGGSATSSTSSSTRVIVKSFARAHNANHPFRPASTAGVEERTLPRQQRSTVVTCAFGDEGPQRGGEDEPDRDGWVATHRSLGEGGREAGTTTTRGR